MHAQSVIVQVGSFRRGNGLRRRRSNGNGRGSESADPIKFILLDWTGNHLTNRIAGEILTQMGYNVEYVQTAQAAAWQGIDEGTLQREHGAMAGNAARRL